MMAGFWFSKFFWGAGAGKEASTETDATGARLNRLVHLSAAVEQFGLVSLLAKIALSRSVAGLSGKTMMVYLGEYTLRFAVTCEFSFDFSEVIYFLAVLEVLAVLYCVFRRNRDTYEAEHDAFPVHYQLPGCLLMPALMEADVHLGLVRDYLWNACLWLEITALLPQVYMIARAKAPVDALLSHFVAATATSRAVDLFYWYFAIGLVAPASGFNFSGLLIVLCHVTHALLLAE